MLNCNTDFIQCAATCKYISRVHTLLQSREIEKKNNIGAAATFAARLNSIQQNIRTQNPKKL